MDTEEIDRMLESLAASERQLNRARAKETGKTQIGVQTKATHDYLGLDRTKAADPPLWKEYKTTRMPVFDYGETKQSSTIPPATPSNPVKATQLKDKGNECFKKGQYKEAVDWYGQAMALDLTNDIYPANRAMAFLKLNKHKEAQRDCTTALKLNPKNIKALLRRATAREALGEYDDAKKDCQKVLLIEPANTQATTTIKKLNSKCQPIEKSTSSSVKHVTKDTIGVLKTNGGVVKGEVQRHPESLTKNLDQPLSNKKPTQPSKTVMENKDIEKVAPLTSTSTIKPSIQVPNLKLNSSAKQLDKGSATSKPMVVTMQNGTPIKTNITIPKNGPKSSYEFEVTWRSLKNYPIKLHQYFQLIPPSTYANVFSDFLTEDMLERILLLLRDYYSDNKAVYDILMALTGVNRFGIVKIFMSQSDKEVLKSLLSRMVDGEGQTIEEGNVDILASKYGLNDCTFNIKKCS